MPTELIQKPSKAGSSVKNLRTKKENNNNDVEVLSLVPKVSPRMTRAAAAKSVNIVSKESKPTTKARATKQVVQNPIKKTSKKPAERKANSKKPVDNNEESETATPTIDEEEEEEVKIKEPSEKNWPKRGRSKPRLEAASLPEANEVTTLTTRLRSRPRRNTPQELEKETTKAGSEEVLNQQKTKRSAVAEPNVDPPVKKTKISSKRQETKIQQPTRITRNTVKYQAMVQKSTSSENQKFVPKIILKRVNAQPKVAENTKASGTSSVDVAPIETTVSTARKGEVKSSPIASQMTSGITEPSESSDDKQSYQQSTKVDGELHAAEQSPTTSTNVVQPQQEEKSENEDPYIFEMSQSEPGTSKMIKHKERVAKPKSENPGVKINLLMQKHFPSRHEKEQVTLKNQVENSSIPISKVVVNDLPEEREKSSTPTAYSKVWHSPQVSRTPSTVSKSSVLENDNVPSNSKDLISAKMFSLGSQGINEEKGDGGATNENETAAVEEPSFMADSNAENIKPAMFVSPKKRTNHLANRKPLISLTESTVLDSTETQDLEESLDVRALCEIFENKERSSPVDRAKLEMRDEPRFDGLAAGNSQNAQLRAQLKTSDRLKHIKPLQEHQQARQNKDRGGLPTLPMKEMKIFKSPATEEFGNKFAASTPLPNTSKAAGFQFNDITVMSAVEESVATDNELDSELLESQIESHKVSSTSF